MSQININRMTHDTNQKFQSMSEQKKKEDKNQTQKLQKTTAGNNVSSTREIYVYICIG